MSGMGDNSRRATINNIKSQLDDVNNRIAELMAERKTIKGQIKADLGWKVADWNVAIRIADLDDDARKVCLDTVAEMWDALGIPVGGQRAFFGDMPEKPAPIDAYAMGLDAGLHGKTATDIPVNIRRRKQHKQDWLRGLAMGQAKRMNAEDAEEFGEADPPAAEEEEHEEADAEA